MNVKKGDIVLMNETSYLVIEDTRDHRKMLMVNLSTYELHPYDAYGYAPSTLNLLTESIDFGKIFRDIIYQSGAKYG